MPARSHGAPLAAAAIARLIPGDVPSTVSIRVDGRSVETTRRGDVYWAPLQGVGQPGEHRIEVELPTGASAIADVGVSYGMPWSAPPLREAPIQLVIDGELGARDTRSAAFLYVRNQGATVLTRPRVELELPAGSELDEDARRELRALLRHPPILEERTLILHLRPLPCLLYTSPSPRDVEESRMPSSA